MKGYHKWGVFWNKYVQSYNSYTAIPGLISHHKTEARAKYIASTRRGLEVKRIKQ